MALWPAILRFAAALAALILRLWPAGCDLRSSNITTIGVGWACDSQIAAGCGPLRFESAAISQKCRSRSGIACGFGCGLELRVTLAICGRGWKATKFGVVSAPALYKNPAVK